MPIEVRPGVGIKIDRVSLTEPKAHMKQGLYDPAPPMRRFMADAPSLDRTSANAKALWNAAENKIFRNAYVSNLIDIQWPSFQSFTTGEQMGLYTVAFDTDGQSSLQPMPPETWEDENAQQIARNIGLSNEAVLMHLMTQIVQAEELPPVSGQPDLDKAYFDRFQEMADFGDTHRITRRALPTEAGTTANFIARGLGTIKVPFSIPNLIDGVVARDEMQLSPDQHRQGVNNAISGFFPHYYRQPFEMTDGIAEELITDPRSQELDANSFMYAGDKDNIIVYPIPDKVHAINDSVRDTDLAVTTSCPFFASKNGRIPLSRSLTDVAFAQWETWYYPQRTAEYSAAI